MAITYANQVLPDEPKSVKTDWFASGRHAPPAWAWFLIGALGLGALSGCKGNASASSEVTLLNVSYDPTRELYEDVNAAFSARYEKEHPGKKVVVRQSHGGSGKQARSVIDGLEADVVTLALPYDIDMLEAKARLLPAAWKDRLPNQSSPATSTIVFVVRKGNPKGVHDWPDLIKPGVKVITPNPKTGGGARYNFLAAYGYALKAPGGDEKKAEDFVRRLFANVPVLDSGARGATTTFAERGLGDVLIAWENEALFITLEKGKDRFETIRPSITVLAEPPVAVVDTYADKHGARGVAEAYLAFLYTDAGQEIMAKHFFRPRNEAIRAGHTASFPNVSTFTVDEVFGSWGKAQKAHFDDGGTFDRIYQPKG